MYIYIKLYICVYIYRHNYDRGSNVCIIFFSSFLLVSDGLSPIKQKLGIPNIIFFWPSAYKDNIIKWSLCPVDPCLSRRGNAGRRRGEAPCS